MPRRGAITLTVALLGLLLALSISPSSAAPTGGSEPLPATGEFCGSGAAPPAPILCPKTLGPSCFCFMGARKTPSGGQTKLEVTPRTLAGPKVPRRSDKPRVLPPFPTETATLEVYLTVPTPPPRG